jgi:uncharacterized membrane protein HdeD (DUF308 family)
VLFGLPRTFVLRGLIAIAFGILLIAWPAISLTVLIRLCGAFALVDGALILTMGIRMRSHEPSRPVALVAGVLTVFVGLVTVLWPGLTALVLVVLVALRAVIGGVAELMIAGRMGWHTQGAWFLASLGFVSIAFGALLFASPSIGILALVWAIGLYAITIGTVGIARGWLLATSQYA